MQEYETIKCARAILETSQASAPSERTVAGYTAKVKLIIRRAGPGADIEKLINEAKQTRSVSTWFSRRAALMNSFRMVVRRLLVEQEMMQRGLEEPQTADGSPSVKEWQEVVRKIGIFSQWHKRLQDEPAPPVEDRRQRHSKRRDLRGLPDDWRERIVTRMPNYRLAALTNAVAGCRPDELTKGIRIAIEGGMLVVTIQGAKVTKKTGQPWRWLCWPTDSDSPLVRALVEEVQGGASVAQITDAKAYSGAMRAAGMREWPRRKTTITPYCMRHAFAADMKAAGSDVAEISGALGHCSDVAKQYYGSASQGGRARAVTPLNVKATRNVRMTSESKTIPLDMPERPPAP